jgi:hypothetical protein
LKSITGEIIKGINKYGFPNYVGSFSDKTDYWIAGYDFNRTLIPIVREELPFMRNYIENGSFEWQINRYQKLVDKSRIDCWEKTGEVELSYSPGFNIPGPDTRNSVYGNSLSLKSNGSGISQTVKRLKPDFPYKIGVYVHSEVSAEVILSVQSKQIQESVSSNDFPALAGWKLIVLSFRTGLQDEEVTVQIRNNGDNIVYLDNIGLVPDLEEVEK